MSKNSNLSEIEKPSVPVMPLAFSGELAEEWNRVICDMTAARIINAECGGLVETYVVNLVRMRQADRHIAEFGLIVSAQRTGAAIENPHLRISTSAARVVAKLAAVLGLSPGGARRKSVRAGKFQKLTTYKK